VRAIEDAPGAWSDADVGEWEAARCLPLGRRAGLRAGALLQALRAAGSEIGMSDSMQAAICLEADLPFVTGNIRHFERVDGLEVVPPERWPRR
jgi:predicted nucleic acid-binding protein